MTIPTPRTWCGREWRGADSWSASGLWSSGRLREPVVSGAADEFLFSGAHQPRWAGLKHKSVDVRHARAVSGPFPNRRPPTWRGAADDAPDEGTDYSRVGAPLAYVDDDAVVLADGAELPFAYALVVPPLAEQDVVRTASSLSDGKWIRAGSRDLSEPGIRRRLRRWRRRSGRVAVSDGDAGGRADDQVPD